jgi:hypothetical protein
VTSSIKSYAVWAKKGYTWTVQKTANPSKLEVKGNTRGSVSYTVSYIRNEVLTAPKLSATVQFDNLKLNGPAHLNTFSYKVTSNCPEGNQVKTGTFTCPSPTIPAGGAPLSCKFKVDLPCAAPGVLLANAVVEDKAVRSNAFNFPAPEPTELADAASDDQLSTGECVMVSLTNSCHSPAEIIPALVATLGEPTWLVTGHCKIKVPASAILLVHVADHGCCNVFAGD